MAMVILCRCLVKWISLRKQQAVPIVFGSPAVYLSQYFSLTPPLLPFLRSIFDACRLSECLGELGLFLDSLDLVCALKKCMCLCAAFNLPPHHHHNSIFQVVENNEIMCRMLKWKRMLIKIFCLEMLRCFNNNFLFIDWFKMAFFCVGPIAYFWSPVLHLASEFHGCFSTNHFDQCNVVIDRYSLMAPLFLAL